MIKKNNPLWILAVLMVFVLVILNIVMSIRISEYKKEKVNYNMNNSTNPLFEGKIETEKKCPDAEGGFEDASLQVKYFYSKFCPWCIKEEPILQKLVKNYGNFIHIDWYNINNWTIKDDFNWILNIIRF